MVTNCGGKLGINSVGLSSVALEYSTICRLVPEVLIFEERYHMIVQYFPNAWRFGYTLSNMKPIRHLVALFKCRQGPCVVRLQIDPKLLRHVILCLQVCRADWVVTHALFM